MAKVALLFPGQGAQHVGMGRIDRRELSGRAGTVRSGERDSGLRSAARCFEGPAAELDTTAVSQPAIFVTSLAALEMLRAENPQAAESCQITAGLSLGEYTALVFAGAMNFADALRVVERRGAGDAAGLGRDAVGDGERAALGSRQGRIDPRAGRRGRRVSNLPIICAREIWSSRARRRPAQRPRNWPTRREAGPSPLTVAGAFHTKLMKPADERLAEALAKVPIRRPRIPVISNVDAKIARRSGGDSQESRAASRQPRAVGRLDAGDARSRGIDEFYEVGPGRVLRGLLKRIDRKAVCQTVNDSP